MVRELVERAVRVKARSSPTTCASRVPAAWARGAQLFATPSATPSRTSSTTPGGTARGLRRPVFRWRRFAWFAGRSTSADAAWHGGDPALARPVDRLRCGSVPARLTSDRRQEVARRQLRFFCGPRRSGRPVCWRDRTCRRYRGGRTTRSGGRAMTRARAQRPQPVPARKSVSSSTRLRQHIARRASPELCVQEWAATSRASKSRGAPRPTTRTEAGVPVACQAAGRRDAGASPTAAFTRLLPLRFATRSQRTAPLVEVHLLRARHARGVPAGPVVAAVATGTVAGFGDRLSLPAAGSAAVGSGRRSERGGALRRSPRLCPQWPRGRRARPRCWSPYPAGASPTCRGFTGPTAWWWWPRRRR